MIPEEANAYVYKLVTSLKPGDQIALTEDNSYSTNSLIQVILFTIRFIQQGKGKVEYLGKMQKLNYAGNLLIYKDNKIKHLVNTSTKIPNNYNFVSYPEYINFLQPYFDKFSEVSGINFPKLELHKNKYHSGFKYSIYHPSFICICSK